MKKSKVLVTSTLLTVLASIVGCGGKTSSNTSVNTSSSSTVISSTTSSSTVPFVYTEDLTQEMFSGLQGGYAAEFFRITDYDSDVQSGTYLETKVNDKNYAFQRFVVNQAEDGTFSKGKLTETSHYQIDPNEEEEWLYNAGLSIGNTVIYTPVLGRDQYTFDDIELTWEEGGYSNVFANLSLSDFTRVDNENKWSLDVSSSSFKSSGAKSLFDSQFFGKAINADIDYFYLLTNGNEITGFDLKWKTYLSYESYITKMAYGTFSDFGSDIVDFVKPLEGRAKDADFDNAMASLKEYNYKVRHDQAGYEPSASAFVSRGYFVGECDSETLNYYYYTSDDRKYMNYSYYNIVEDGETYLQGATKINDNFYPDVAYYGTLNDILPSFNISSEMFIKQDSSTEDVLVYKLDKSVIISLDNDNATYSSFDSDGYNDRTVYLTVTIDKVNNTVNFHNETTDLVESGLFEDVFYYDIGKVDTIRTDANTKTNCDELSWADLLSNDEAGYEAFSSKFPSEILENLPTLGGRYAYVNYDQSGIIFVTTYEKAENEELLASYGAKLVAAGYEAGETSDEYGTYPTYYTKFTSRGRTYGLTLTLMTFWNKTQEWGQFQIHISVSAAK